MNTFRIFFAYVHLRVDSYVRLSVVYQVSIRCLFFNHAMGTATRTSGARSREPEQEAAAIGAATEAALLRVSQTATENESCDEYR